MTGVEWSPCIIGTGYETETPRFGWYLDEREGEWHLWFYSRLVPHAQQRYFEVVLYKREEADEVVKLVDGYQDNDSERTEVKE